MTMRALGLGAAAGACIALAAPAGPAVADKLPVPRASERSSTFATRTCARDEHCVRSGVLNCRRQAPRTVLCRIFDERKTRLQGRYRCERLIRVELESRRRTPVTGVGRWHC
jgi:hypothetical protein